MRLWLVPTRDEASHLVPDMRFVPHGGFWRGEDETGTWVICGIGPAAAAMTAAMMIAAFSPERISLVGIAGAFHQSGLVPGDLVQAREERFADLGYRDGNRFLDLDAMGFPMLARPDGDLGCRLPAEPMTTTIPAVDFLTVSQLTNSAETADALVGSFGAAVENMEGAGVALAAHQAAITFHELRAVSNLVGPRDRSAWQVREPLIRLGELIRALSAGRSPR